MGLVIPAPFSPPPPPVSPPPPVVSSPPPSSPTNEDDKNLSTSNGGTIAGGVVGGIIGVAVIAGLVYVVATKKLGGSKMTSTSVDGGKKDTLKTMESASDDRDSKDA